MSLRPLFALLAVALLGACTAAEVPVAPAQSASPLPAGPISAESFPRWTVQEAHERISRGEAILIVDVRSKSAYDAEHVAGAVNHPWADLTAGHDLPPKDKLLLLYCTWGNEHSSAGAAADLHNLHGYDNMAVLLGGMRAWVEAGYATAKVN